MRVVLVSLLLVLAISCVFSTSSAAAPVWANAGHDAQRTGQSPFPGNRGWFANWTQGVTAASSVVLDSNNQVYLNDGAVTRSYDGNTGEPLWATSHGSTSQVPALGPDGTVIVVTGTCNVLGLAPSTGAIVWSVNISSACSGSVTSVVAHPTQTFLYFSNGGVLYSVSYFNNFAKLAWTASSKIVGSLMSGASVSPDGSTVYAHDSNYVFGLNAFSGAQVWSGYINEPINPSSWVMVSPVTSTVYVTTSNNIWGLNSDNGDQNFHYSVFQGPNGNPVIDASGNLYFLDYYGAAYSINSTGNYNWKTSFFNDAGYSTGLMALDSSGGLYLSYASQTSSYEDSIYVLTTASGSVKWSHSVNTGGFAIGSNGLLYVVSNQVLYALN